jgi:hypothetical protein
MSCAVRAQVTNKTTQSFEKKELYLMCVFATYVDIYYVVIYNRIYVS